MTSPSWENREKFAASREKCFWTEDTRQKHGYIISSYESLANLFFLYFNIGTNNNKTKTRSGSRWHAIANPHASGRNCPCTTQHSFKQPGKILLVCYSTHHSLQFDMPHDHVVRNLIFDPAPPPKSHPKGCSWGYKVNPVQYVLHLSLLSICAHFRIKIL